MNHRRRIIILILLLIVGIFLRILFLHAVGNRFDRDSFLAWANAIEQHGLTSIYQATIPSDVSKPNYPPVFLYILWGMVKLFGHLTPLLVKIPGILIDLTAGIFVWSMFKKEKVSTQAFAAALILLNPAVFLLSAYWCQVDMLYALFAALALVAASRGRFSLSALFFTLGFFSKIQTIVIFPLLLTLLITARRSLLKPILTGVISSLVLVAPFLFTGHLSDLWRPLVEITRSYPYLSVNAMNLWWPIDLGQYLSDYTPILGIPAIYLGIFFTVLAMVLPITFLTKKRSLAGVMLAASFATLAFYFFETNMHERYFFPLFLFLPFLITEYRRIAIITLALVSVSFIANIFYLLPYGNGFLSHFVGVKRFFFLDSWWLVNGAALAILGATLYRQVKNYENPRLTSRL